MEKRALLAVILSLLVIIIYQYFFLPEPPLEPPITEDQNQLITDKKQSSLSHGDQDQIGEALLKENILSLLKKQEERKPREICIQTSKYKAIINTMGARITSWELNDFYKTQEYETSPLNFSFWKMVWQSYKHYFSFLAGSKPENTSPKPINLFQRSTNGHGSSLAIMEGHDPKAGVLINGIFDTEADDLLVLSPQELKKTIQFSYILPQGLQVDKIYTFHNDTYLVDVDVAIKNLTDKGNSFDYNIVLGPGLGNALQPGAHKYEGPLTLSNGRKIKDKPKNKAPLIHHEGPVSWAALTSNYFLAAIIPMHNESEIFVQRPMDERISPLDLNRRTIISLHPPERIIDPRSARIDKYSFYFGPKDYQQLKALGFHLDQAIDYGFFSFLARPLMWILNQFHTFIPNYGLAIVLLTILIKIIFWPLTDKSFKSMKEMQGLQPKMTALREKYKSDPKKLNEEIMSLYRQKGVNPMGGCLPLLLQIPVFFALYEGLMVAIEMRGAPFVLWIKDLSAMDPLLITPLLMGITMYFQQKMTPMSTDSAQMKMMMFLPLIFTVFFLGFPSGLVIYWLLNNVLTIGQHYFILKKMGA